MKIIRLILLKKGNLLDIVKAKWDETTNLAKIKNQRYYVDSKHFFYRKKRIYAFVDINRSKSISGNEVLGESVEPNLSDNIDMKLQNYLNYLTERSFWQSLKTLYKRDYLIIIMSFFCGMGIWHIILTILKSFGVVIP